MNPIEKFEQNVREGFEGGLTRLGMRNIINKVVTEYQAPATKTPGEQFSTVDNSLGAKVRRVLIARGLRFYESAVQGHFWSAVFLSGAEAFRIYGEEDAIREIYGASLSLSTALGEDLAVEIYTEWGDIFGRWTSWEEGT